MAFLVAGDKAGIIARGNAQAHPPVFARLLAVCRERDLACGGTVTPANAALRMEQGYRIFNFGGANGGLTAANAAARSAVIAAGAQR